MKKIFAVVAAVAVSSASLFAYNPPFGGEELFRLTNPEMLSGSSSSAAGGPAFNVIPASITYNPALPAGSEILTFDVSGTLFANLDKEDGDKSAGGAFEIGVLYPTSWGTFTATFNSVISELYRMPLGKIHDFHAGAAKDINDWLDQFDMFSIYEVLPQILELWGDNMKTDVTAKKELAEVNGK